eukprot:6989025-Pyramimonas_sp.AAC.1
MDTLPLLRPGTPCGDLGVHLLVLLQGEVLVGDDDRLPLLSPSTWTCSALHPRPPASSLLHGVFIPPRRSLGRCLWPPQRANLLAARRFRVEGAPLGGACHPRGARTTATSVSSSRALPPRLLEATPAWRLEWPRVRVALAADLAVGQHRWAGTRDGARAGVVRRT